MAYNHGYRGFPAPNNHRMMIPPPNIHTPPRFNNTSPWNHPPPPMLSQPPPPLTDQSPYNIYNFMQPPHMMQRPNFPPNNVFPRGGPSHQVQRHFTPDNTFTQEAPSSPHENFPFNNNGCGPGFQNNGHFQGHRGRGRGFMGGQGFRGGFRGGVHNGNQNNVNNKTKKEKVDKRDLPENNAYFCDICDRGFKTQDKYQEHTDGHITCSFKDCPFIAAPKLVHLHARMQHSSGLAKKVWTVKSADDINKWREERKRNYPTTDNVAKKKQEKQDRIDRGEVLQTKEFGKMWQGRGRHRGRGRHGRGRGRGRWRDYDRNEVYAQADGGSDSEGPPEEIEIQKSKGDENLGQPDVPEVAAATPATELQALVPASESNKLLQVLTAYGESSSDGQGSGDEYEQSPVDSDTKPATQSTASPSKLVSPQKSEVTSLVNGVSLSGTTPSVEPQNQATSQDIAAPIESSPLAVNGISSGSPHKSASHGASLSISSGDPTKTSPSSVSGQNQKHNNQSRLQNGRDHKEKQGNKRAAGSEQGNDPPHKKKREQMKRPVHRYTLLEKLLAPDMRKERNKILQCAHYIVKNKFFE